MSGPLTGHGFQFSIARQRYVPARGSLVRLQPEALMIIRVRHGPLVEPATRARQRHIHGVVHLMCLRMANLAVVCGELSRCGYPDMPDLLHQWGFDVQDMLHLRLPASGLLRLPCDECRKARQAPSRGRNPYTSKAHRLARARVLARIRDASAQVTDPTDAAGTMACAAPPAPSPTIGRSNESSSSKPDWTPTTRHACAACASVATTARRQERNLQASTDEAFADSSLSTPRTHAVEPSRRRQRAPQT